MKKRIIPLMLVFALLLVALPVTASAEDGVFEDVSPDAYYARAVRWAVSWGVTNGTSETTFSPDLTCTRGQVVTFLWRAHGEPEPKADYNPFADVPKGSYYDRATLWAVEQGITTGTSVDPMQFSPDKPCTCAEILSFIWRAKGSPAPYFPSPLTSDWGDSYYKDAVTWADNTAMLEDGWDLFDPDLPCTRGRTVSWLWLDAREHVSDAEHLMRAIGPGREILLDPGVYNLTEWVKTVGTDTGNPFVKLEFVNDGYEIVIHDVRNLTFCPAQPGSGTVEIVVEPRYANVLTFENCDIIILTGITAGHTPEKGYCTGGVLCFRDCGRIALGDMDLYGCGTYGIIGERVDSIQTVDSEIHDCSYGMIDFRQVRDAGFGDVVFRDCAQFDMLCLRESSAFFQSCSFLNNTWEPPYSHFLEMDALSGAAFRSCTFDQLAYDDLTEGMQTGKNIVLEAPSVA